MYMNYRGIRNEYWIALDIPILTRNEAVLERLVSEGT